MANKTIAQALKDLFTELGGNPSALSDNSDISDYIDDLAIAIKAAAAHELPDVSEVADGAILAVIDGAWTLCTMSVDTTTGDITFTPVED